MAQFFIFLMISVFSILYLLENSIVNIPHWQVVWTMRLAHVCGLLGAIFWFMALELVKTNGFENTLTRILNYRSQYLYVGLIIGVNIFSVDFHVVSGQIITFYIIPFSYFLTPSVYLLFLWSQYSLFKNRIKELSQRSFILSIVINVYLISIFLGIVLLITGFAGIAPTDAWILFASLSQLTFSYLLYKIPLVLLINEQPDMVLFFSSDFKELLHVKKFSDSTKLSEDFIASYLSGLSALGSKIVYGSGKINKISFRDHIALVNSVDDKFVCYFYKGQSYYSHTRFDNFCKSLLKNKNIWPWESKTKDESIMKNFDTLIENYFGKEKIILPDIS